MFRPIQLRRTSSYSQRGFTLIELLIALSIFTFISAATFVAMRSAVDSYSTFLQIGKRESQLETVIALLTQDLLQIVPRASRGVSDEYNPAFMLRQGKYLMEFSRSGLPLESTVSGLQRIAYDIADGSLARYSWPYMDLLPITKKVETVLLTDVKKIEITAIDEKLKEHRSWPPTDLVNIDASQLLNMPQAINIRIETEEGEFERLVPGVSNVFFGLKDADRQKTIGEFLKNLEKRQ